jgi:hypothetical protein
MRTAAAVCLAFALVMPLRAAGADPCTLTFPPSKDTAAFETNLRAFLNARCYVTLGWTHDPFVRDTGPLHPRRLLRHASLGPRLVLARR